MKILYINNSRIPTEKAHGFQICKMCEQFASAGCQVELWVPQRQNHIAQDTFEYYNLKNNFRIKKIKSFNWFIFQPLIKSWAFKLQSLFFFLNLFFKKPNSDSIIYTRNPEIAWLFKKKKYKVVFSAHSWPQSKNKLFKFFLFQVDYIICNSQGTAQAYIDNNFNITLVAPNGVELEKFNIKLDKLALRKKLNLPQDKKIIMYVGHLYKWKGIDVIISSAKKFINNQSIIFVIVGGTQQDIEKYKNIIAANKLFNILIIGHQPYKLMVHYFKAADILLLPNIANTQESIKYTSPIKMFEYMASGTPIIASDLPSIKEILNQNNSLLFKAGNSSELKQKISTLLNNFELSQKISQKALNDVKYYTWQKRTEKILNFIK